MGDQKKVLLAFGEGVLEKTTHKALQKTGYQVTAFKWAKELRLPKKTFDFIIHMGKDPTSLTEGTRPLLEKAKRDKSTFLLISDLRATTKPVASKEATVLEAFHFAEALTQEFHRKHGLKTVVLRLATVFGPDIPLERCGPLGHLIAEFANPPGADKPALTLYGDGQDRSYYLYLGDAVQAVKLGLKIEDKHGSVYFAAPSAPISSANIAKILRKRRGECKIRYHKGLVPLEEEPKLEDKPLPKFKSKVTVEKGIAKVLERLPQAGKQRKKKPAKAQHRSKLSLSTVIRGFECPSRKTLIRLAIFLLIIAPFIHAGAQIGLTLYRLKNLRSQVAAFDFQAAEKTAKLAQKSFTSLGRLSGAVPLLSQRAPLRDITLISQAGAEASGALAKVLAQADVAVDALENILKSFKGETFEWQKEEDFARLASALKESEADLVAAKLYLDQLGPLFHQPLSSLTKPSQEVITAVRLVEGFAANGFDLLGYEGQRGYLVLFQNSAELRAGGGFLGSLAHLVFKNGALAKLDFYDSYQLDSAPKITAPAAFKRFRGKKEIPLREANFFASFPVSAKNIAEMFGSAQNVEIDGIIGINLHFVQGLLGVTGGFELPEFDKTITADNLFAVTTEEVEKDFFPGSTKKKRFLQALGEGLIDSLFDLGRDKYDQLAQVAWDALNKKHLLLYFEDGEITQHLVSSGFDGRVKATDQDYLTVIDSSFGSKANLLGIERSIDYAITTPTKNGRLRGTLTVAWNHTGSKNWPAGTYNNVFRALVPAGSRLISSRFKGKKYNSEIFVSEESGKKVFATEIKVKPQSQATLQLVYDLPAGLNLKNLNSYTLCVQKQPGTVADGFTFSFEEPFEKMVSGEVYLTPYGQSQALQKEGTSLIFKGALDHDITLKVNIEAKE